MSRRLLLPLLAVTCVAACAPAAGAAPLPAYPAQGGDAPERWERLAGEMAEPWIDLQRSNGTFKDYLQSYLGKASFSRYGEAFLGYGLLQTGLRLDKPLMVRAGMRGLRWSVTRSHNFFGPRQSNFENFAVPAAYNIVRREIPDNDSFEANRHAWIRFIAGRKSTRLGGKRQYHNHFLVDAVGVLEQLGTGVRSSSRRTNLGGQRGRIRRLAFNLINHTLPRVAERYSTVARGRRAAFVSDFPTQTMAYHGLTVGLYARAIRLMGPRASRRAHRALRQLVDAAWLMTAPDGDLAWWGRSQELSWSLALTAYGAEVAAKLPGTSGALDARYHALSERVLARLRDMHGSGPGGLYITPGLRLSIGGYRALDAYATTPPYTGLTLVAMNWALDEMRGARPIGEIASQRRLRATLSKGESRFAVVRRGNVWFSVRMTRSRRGYARDLRYDMGLVALKLRGANGQWRDVMPLRPKTDKRRSPKDSAGPVLRVGTGLPFGSRMGVSGEGTVTVRGLYRGNAYRRRTWFRFEPISCGVRISFPASRKQRLRHSFFFLRDGSRPAIGTRRLADETQSIRSSLPFRAAIDGRSYSSGSQPRLLRIQAIFRASRAQTVRFSICGR